MRSALFFAVLALLMISTHAWQPSWNEFKESARKHMEQAKEQLAALKKHLPPNVQHTLKQAMDKLNEHQVKKDVHHAMETMHRDLLTKWRNLAASQGLQVRDHNALKALMNHMALAQARLNMEKATMMETYAHHLATHLIGEKRPAQDIKALSSELSTLGHKYMRKFTEGAEKILHKNGLNLNQDQVHKALQHTYSEATKGKPVMEALMEGMKKVGVNTAGLDGAVKDQMKAHIEKLKKEGMAELQKTMTAHKVPMKIEQVVASVKSKSQEMMAKMKAMQGATPKILMGKVQELAQKAFKNMKPGDHKALMMKLHLIIRSAMDSHFYMIAQIFKKHKMEGSHTVIHYTIYHRMKETDHHDKHRHRRWWHKKSVRLALAIGGGIFGVAVLVALIVVLVHMVKEKRRAPKTKVDGEKCTLPYSVMDEKASNA